MIHIHVVGGGINTDVKEGDGDVLIESERGTVSAIVNAGTGDISIQLADAGTVDTTLGIDGAYSTTPKKESQQEPRRESVWFHRLRI